MFKGALIYMGKLLYLWWYCLHCRSIPGAIGYGDPREIKRYVEDHGVKCWIDVERVGQVTFDYHYYEYLDAH